MALPNLSPPPIQEGPEGKGKFSAAWIRWFSQLQGYLAALGAGGGGGGGVTAVTGSGNIASSGGATPNITFTGILPIANGGNGSGTPGISAGAGVSVAGSWPNQTVSASGASPLTTKGDLYTYSTANARQPAGSDGQVVAYDSTQTTGLVAKTLPTATNLPHSFYAYRSANQTIATGSDVKIQFDAKLFDTNNEYDNVTNFQFKPTTPGYYKCTVQACAGAATFVTCSIFKNGTLYSRGDAGSGRSSMATLVFLNGTTDFIQGFAFCTGSGLLNVGVPTGSDNFFCGVLVAGTSTGVPMQFCQDDASGDRSITTAELNPSTLLMSIAASVGDKLVVRGMYSMTNTGGNTPRIGVKFNGTLDARGTYKNSSIGDSNLTLVHTVVAGDISSGVVPVQISFKSDVNTASLQNHTGPPAFVSQWTVENFGDGSGVPASQGAGFQIQALPQYDREGTVGTGTGVASRGIAIPLELKAPMYVASLQMVISISGAGTVAWGLYDYSGSPSSAALLVSGSGVFGSTGSQKLAASAVTLVRPGAYMLVLVPPATGLPTFKQVGSLNTALPAPKVKSSVTITSTIDLTTGWAFDSALPEVVLVGQLSATVAW